MIVLMLFLHLDGRTFLVLPIVLVTAIAAIAFSPWLFVITLAVILAAGFSFARGALVVSLAIPTSIVGTFMLLNLMGRSLNVISLAGLAFAIGMLVDNAVVVLENIYRHYLAGDPPVGAAVRATKEVWGAVIASTLTTIAVFVPVVFVKEEAGQLFLDIALAICCAVGLSLLVSVTVIPTASARLLRRRDEDADEEMGAAVVRLERRPTEPASPLGRLLAKLGRMYVDHVVWVNRWVQQRTWRRLAVIASLVGASVVLSYYLWPPVEYLPTGNRNLVFGILLPPPGYNLDKLAELGQQLERGLQPYWDIDDEDLANWQQPLPPIDDFFYVAAGRQVFMGLRAVDPMRADQMVPMVYQVSGQIPGTFVVASQMSLFGRELTSGRTIDIEITGPKLDRLVELGGQIMGQVGQTVRVELRESTPEDRKYATANAFPQPSLDLSNPEIHVHRKPIQAGELGVDATELGYTVNALVDGAYAADYFKGGDKIDLVILGAPQYAARTQDLAALPIATETGQLVPLGALADVSIAGGPEQINRRERERTITIQVSPPPQMALEEAIEKINTQIVGPLRDRGQLAEGYKIRLSGTVDKLRTTWDALKWNVLLALVITYLLMAALFESWLYPLVVIFSVPLGAVGGIAGLFLLNRYLAAMGFAPQLLDVLTMLGFVILIGTVVNNAILIVHQSLNHIRIDNMPHRQAILESVRNRIRPICMTTATTVCGLSPLVFFPGAGSELYRGLGAVVLGGLVVSTVFTLLLVPTLFSLMMDLKDWLSPAKAAPPAIETILDLEPEAQAAT
jgi:HAE1 family hydrophobic/amphiphilic exporter-1